LTFDAPLRRLTPALFIPGTLTVLAEADLEEHQEHGADEPDRHQDESEDFAGETADERGAQRAGDNQSRRRPKRQ
jgi:hypothetical protein